jgi:hypothetical protein
MEQQINNNKEYYITESYSLAKTMSYLLGREFFRFNNKFDETKKVYSFKDDEEFRRVLTLVYKIRHKQEIN